MIEYLKNNDGFVIAYTNTIAVDKEFSGITDANAVPVAVRAYARDDDDTTLFIAFPAKKSDYWKVTLTGVGATATILWIPLGS